MDQDIEPAQPLTKPKCSHALVLWSFVVAGVLIIASVVVFLTVDATTKRQYFDAGMQYRKVVRGALALRSSVTVISSGLIVSNESNFNNSIKQAEEGLVNLKAERDTLSTMSAVQSPEAKEQYDAFNAKLTPFLTFSEEVIASSKKSRTTIDTCWNVSLSTVTAQGAAADSCAISLKSLGELPSDEFNDTVDVLGDLYDSYTRGTISYADFKDGYDTEYTQFIDEIKDTNASLYKPIASDTFGDYLSEREG